MFDCTTGVLLCLLHLLFHGPRQAWAPQVWTPRYKSCSMLPLLGTQLLLAVTRQTSTRAIDGRSTLPVCWLCVLLLLQGPGYHLWWLDSAVSAAANAAALPHHQHPGPPGHNLHGLVRLEATCIAALHLNFITVASGHQPY